MPQVTLTELAPIAEGLQAALKTLQQLPTNVTSNPDVDKGIRKGYKQLSKALAAVNSEIGLT